MRYRATNSGTFGQDGFCSRLASVALSRMQRYKLNGPFVICRGMPDAQGAAESAFAGIDALTSCREE